MISKDTLLAMTEAHLRGIAQEQLERNARALLDHGYTEDDVAAVIAACVPLNEGAVADAMRDARELLDREGVESVRRASFGSAPPQPTVQ